MPDRTSEAEIYVGYLPLPYKQRLILLWLVPALVLLVCVAALVWAALPDPLLRFTRWTANGRAAGGSG